MKSFSTIFRNGIVWLLCTGMIGSLKVAAQCDPPSLVFKNPELVSGIDGEVNATYKFSNVTPGADAYIRIDSLVGGAQLLNIDVTAFGYSDAWQPQVGGPSAPLGHKSYIRWEVAFTATGTNSPYFFNCFSLSAVDIDGDNVMMQEFIEAAGVVNYSYLTPTVLNFSQSGSTITVQGPVDNRKDIDTLADDTRVRFDYSGVDKIIIKTGAKINMAPRPGTPNTDRYNCLYFRNIIGNALTLPVKFTSFNAGLKANKSVQLNWQTETELNNKQFELERSEDGKTYHMVGLVFPNDNGQASHQYQFNDALKGVSSGTIFYRIKQVDKDGNYMYSKIVSVKMASTMAATAEKLIIGPNPVSSEFSLSPAVAKTGMRYLRILNVSGAEVYKKDLSGENAVLRINTENANMRTAGIYLVELTLTDGTRSTQKILKQ